MDEEQQHHKSSFGAIIHDLRKNPGLLIAIFAAIALVIYLLLHANKNAVIAGQATGSGSGTPPSDLGDSSPGGSPNIILDVVHEPPVPTNGGSSPPPPPPIVQPPPKEHHHRPGKHHIPVDFPVPVPPVVSGKHPHAGSEVM